MTANNNDQCIICEECGRKFEGRYRKRAYQLHKCKTETENENNDDKTWRLLDKRNPTELEAYKNGYRVICEKTGEIEGEE